MRITVEAEDWTEERIAERVARLVQEQIQQRVNDAVDLAIPRWVDTTVAAIGEEMIRTAVAEAVDAGWQATNAYGEPTGERATLKSRIAKMLTEKVGSSYDRQKPRVESIAAETLEAALRTEMKKELEEARVAFRKQVDEVLAGKLTEALREAVGLKR